MLYDVLCFTKVLCFMYLYFVLLGLRSLNTTVLDGEGWRSSFSSRHKIEFQITFRSYPLGPEAAPATPAERQASEG